MMDFSLNDEQKMIVEEQFGHTTDILIRRAFGNIYEPLLVCKGEQIERWLKHGAALFDVHR
jgi:acyl-CoA dehydrogenase